MVKLLILWFISLQFLSIATFNWCEKKEDCLVTGTTCGDLNFCECEPGKILNRENDKCLEVSQSPNYICEVNEQCDWIIGKSECIDGTCACQSGYRYLHGKCIKYADYKENCIETEDCYDRKDFKSLICKNKVCECNEEYYNRSDIDCRPIAKNINDTCVIDNDCQNENTVCQTGICTIKDDPVEKYAEIYEVSTTVMDFDQVCKQSSDCGAIPNSFCLKYLKKCSCSLGYTYMKSLGECVLAIGEECDGDVCKILNSECIQGVCQCQKYYIPGNLNEKCYKPTREIGFSCARDNNCFSFGINAVCNDKKCICNNKSKYDTTLNLCVPTKGDEKCQSDSDCALKQYSECVRGRCKCKNKYREENSGRCFPDIGSPCNDDCNLPHVVCNKDRICACEDDLLPMGDLDCVQKLPDIRETCQYDVQCQNLMGIGGTCQDEKCSCKEEFILQEDICKRILYLGDVCNKMSDCLMITANNTRIKCRNGFCSCEYGFKIAADRQNCIADNSSTKLNTSTWLISLLILILTKNGMS